MNVSKFKNLIKECVREVIKEEMTLISESINQKGTSFPYNGNSPQVSLSEDFQRTGGGSVKFNPIEAMLMETAQEMSPTDRKNVGI
jgi:hypothetical protein